MPSCPHCGNPMAFRYKRKSVCYEQVEWECIVCGVVLETTTIFGSIVTDTSSTTPQILYREWRWW